MKETLLFNEIHTPIFEKNNKASKRSLLQLQSVLLKNQKGGLKTFKFNEKAHSTMKKKVFIPLYA